MNPKYAYRVSVDGEKIKDVKFVKLLDSDTSRRKATASIAKDYGISPSGIRLTRMPQLDDEEINCEMS